MPHGTLDLLRGCNVRCPGCYNTQARAIKPLEQIQDELHELMRHRRLQAVSLVGGEPTLHPQLIQIVQYIAAQHLRVALLSNGILIEPALIRALRHAGLDVIYLHIQSGQERADLPAHPNRDQLRALRREKTELIAREGLQVGLSVIAYRSKLGELCEMVREVIESPCITYLLVTEFIDPSKFVGLTGDLESGLQSQRGVTLTGDAMGWEEVDNGDILNMMRPMGLRPFASLGSTADQHEPRWLLYRVGVARSDAIGVRHAGLKSGLSDRILVRLPYWLLGRYIFFHKAYPLLFRMQLLMNAVSGGRLFENLWLLAASCRRGAKLEDKYLLFQQGPNLTADGNVVMCRNCPDATILNGRLVPVCLADRFIEEEPALRTATVEQGSRPRWTSWAGTSASDF